MGSVSDTPDRATSENERIRNKKDFDDFYKNLKKQDEKMSYYRLRADFENTFQHGRYGRSCSLPRDTSAINYDRLSRARSVSPERFRHEPALPFSHRAASVPPTGYLDASRSRFALNLSPSWDIFYNKPSSYYHNYPRSYFQGYSLDPFYRRSYYDSEPFSYGTSFQDMYSEPYNNGISLSDYYGNNKYSNYALSSTRDVLGDWRHYNRSSETLKMRNQRASSPLESRELNRYFSTAGRTDSVADIGSKGWSEFRHYNYGAVPYFGSSDNYHNLNKMLRNQYWR